jgi:hypothetical protein
MCSPALQPLHHPADCHLRRQRDLRMRVILRHVPLHDRYFMLRARAESRRLKAGVLTLPVRDNKSE